MINDLFLRPLPAADPGRLVVITQKTTQMPFMLLFSYPDFLDFQRSAEGDGHDFPEMAKAFSGIMAYLESAVQMSRQGEAAERTYVHMVSGNYFTVLGAQPMMGRLFLPNEGRTVGADAIIVLTYDTWNNRFAADPHIVGQLVKINGLPFTVVGVTQPEFVGAELGHGAERIRADYDVAADESRTQLILHNRGIHRSSSWDGCSPAQAWNKPAPRPHW